MYEQVVGKRQRVVQTLAERISAGLIAPGERLGGEHELAREFDVSRGTIRQALGELQARSLIATRGGIGSFVTYDGHDLDQDLGWARSLADGGIQVTTTVLGIEPVEVADIPGLPAGVDLPRAVAVRRVRSTTGDGPTRVVSFECASLPATGGLADLPTAGLVDGSVTATLRAAGLVASRGEQSVDVRALDEREAGILQRPVGTAFLRSSRTSFDPDGRFVEHVVSLLDPAHFRLRLTFGTTA